MGHRLAQNYNLHLASICTWLPTTRTDVPKQLSFVGKKSTLVLANFDHFRDFSVKSKQNRQIEPSWTTSMRVSCAAALSGPSIWQLTWLTPAFAMQSTQCKPALHLHGSDNVHNSNVNHALVGLRNHSLLHHKPFSSFESLGFGDFWHHPLSLTCRTLKNATIISIIVPEEGGCHGLAGCSCGGSSKESRRCHHIAHNTCIIVCIVKCSIWLRLNWQLLDILLLIIACQFISANGCSLLQ